MLSQYLQYLDHLDNTSLLAGQTHVLGISVFFFITSRSQVEHRNTGKQYLLTRTLHVPYLKVGNLRPAAAVSSRERRECHIELELEKHCAGKAGCWLRDLDEGGTWTRL